TLGNSIIYESGVGNIGIGTTTPDAKLDIQGGSSTAVNAQSSSSNAISATSSAGGGWAAVRANATAPDTYGIWGSSSNYVGGRFESDSGIALETSTSSGHAATFMGGNVGIGTTNPQYALHIKNNPFSGIFFDTDSYPKWAIGSYDNIAFRINQADSNGSVNRLHIEPGIMVLGGGKVGIGASIPRELLEVLGYSTRILVSSFGGNPELNLEMYGGDKWQMYLDEATGDLRFSQAGDKLTIEDGTGHVGIGMTNPTSKLDVAGSDGSNPIIRGINSLHGAGIYGQSSSGYGVYGKTSGTTITSYGVYGENLSAGQGGGVLGQDKVNGNYGILGSIDGGVQGIAIAGIGVFGSSNTGTGVWGRASISTNFGGYFEGRGYFSHRVGIGTATPDQLLHVYGESNPRILIEAPASATPEFNLKRGTETWSMWMNSNNDLDFFNNGSKVTFAANGNVGIGTTSPNDKLDVNGNININSVYKIGWQTVLAHPATNIFVGVGAGENNTTGYQNTFLGRWAGRLNTEGYSNTFLGHTAGNSNTLGNWNAFLGGRAGYHNQTGNSGTFLGDSAGYYNQTGNSNTFLGNSAGFSNTTGDKNTIIGDSAGLMNTTGNGNVFIGRWAGYNETGSNKLYIANTETPIPLIYGDFVLGKVGIGTASPSAQLEVHSIDTTREALIAENTVNGHKANIVGSWYGVYATGGEDDWDFYAGSTSFTYGSASSIRWKKDIQPIDKPLDKVMDLRGVYFNWDADHGGKHGMGMIAEEVGKVLPEIVTYEDNGKDASGMDYSKLTPLLVEAVKAHKKETDQLQKQLAEKTSEITDLKYRLNKLEAMVSQLSQNQQGDVQ
ncbi:MAG: hypothetical protein GY869_25365, partial [Planctomycetes bacterium]|nr:hypothetical protein [Planctomycetota bacterium]